MVNALEIQPQFLALVVVTEVQCLLVYADARRIVAAVVARRSMAVYGEHGAPVVWQVDDFLVIESPADVYKLLPRNVVC